MELSSAKTQLIEQIKHNTWTGVYEVFLRSSATDPRVQLIYLYLIYRGKFLYVGRILKQSLRLLSDLQGTNQIIYIGEAMATHVVLDAVDDLSGHGGIHEVVRTDFDG